MHAVLQIVASNAAVFAVLAACITLLGRFWKNPVGLHLLWVLALLKLITPLITVPLPLPTLERPATAVAAVPESSGDRSAVPGNDVLAGLRQLPPSAFPFPPSAGAPRGDGSIVRRNGPVSGESRTVLEPSFASAAIGGILARIEPRALKQPERISIAIRTPSGEATLRCLTASPKASRCDWRQATC